MKATQLASRQMADEALLRSTTASTADLALRDVTFIEITNPAAGLTGTLVTTSYTPKVTGRLLIWADVSGVCDAANRLATFTIGINGGGVTFTVDASPGGDAAHSLNASLARVFVGVNAGVATTITWTWSVDAGTFQPGSGRGGITIMELPA